MHQNIAVRSARASCVPKTSQLMAPNVMHSDVLGTHDALALRTAMFLFMIHATRFQERRLAPLRNVVQRPPRPGLSIYNLFIDLTGHLSAGIQPC